MKERIFIKKAKEHIGLEEFIRSQFVLARTGRIDIQYTPLGTRIIIHTMTPGLVIGAGGERIREIVERLKEDFGLENPQIDVQKVTDPDLDPNVVAQNIASSLERGVNYKRLGNFFLDKIMNAGAIGCEIVISGKLGSEKARSERFIAGYIKKCGEPAQRDVVRGFATANPKQGVIGVLVKIMLFNSEKKISVDNIKFEDEPAEVSEEKKEEKIEEEK
ncbi:MAG: 30S ribosomal protein S3 [Candidatus Aenigmarchaeota archaeon]|nr:30S ribosomal protein S3 [Candidatus Aenigmarchaeota archaeon]